MANIVVTFKGLTGVLGTVTIDDTLTLGALIVAIATEEGLPTDYYAISVENNPAVNDTTYDDSTVTIGGTLPTGAGITADTRIICTLRQQGTKERRQIQKLEVAQVKRKGTFRDTGTYTNPEDAPYYRTNNTYALSALPDTYNGNFPGADDNENAGGLLPFRPWNTAVGVAGVDVSALTLSAGLIQRIYDDYFGYDSVDQAGGDTNDQTHYTAYFSGSPAYAPAPPTSTPTAITALSFTPASGNAVGEHRSITILGYFKPDVTGTWNFRIRSDDGSYLFLGTNAEVNDNFAPDNIILANAVVDNGGRHAAANASGNFYLEAGSYYYMYAIFGNDTGPGTAEFFYTKPGGSEDDDFTGLIFYNTATDGQ